MMISSPYAGAAALDRALRTSNSGGDVDALASASETKPIEAGPDVVVTLSQGGSSPATYNASGRMSGAPSLDDMGANRPGSLAHATESAGSGDETPPASSDPADSGTDASADADTDTALAA